MYPRLSVAKSRAEFSNSTQLDRLASAEPNPDLGRGALEVGDRLLLMTDALAKWFLHTHESGGDPWEPVALALAAEEPETAFADWITELRDREQLRNDDVTLLSIEEG